MKNFNPTAAFKPEKRVDLGNNPESEAFDFEQYRHELAQTLRSIRNGDPEKGITPDPIGAEQYLKQERIKSRYNAALELHRRKENELRGKDYEHRVDTLIEEYEEYVAGNEHGIIGKEKFEDPEQIERPNYDVIDESPIYPYEDDLKLSAEQKKKMMKMVVEYLRTHNIFVQFSKTINDVSADDTKAGYIKLNEDGSRDLPIGELMGNKIILNPWNVDFMSTFLTIGHLYGHMVQEMNLKEYAGIRKFLTYPKPLDMEVVQREYAEMYGGRDYRADFKIFEEEAFAYAKYTFQQAGVEWTPELEHAMRTYIDTDFDELWEWSTQNPEKSAQDFMTRFEEYYNDEDRKKAETLKAKEVGIVVVPSGEGEIRVVREGQL
ncbi:MAG TPA: hypothetical protein VJH67_01135 [Candidatus Paceibacterota bacterium]